MKWKLSFTLLVFCIFFIAIKAENEDDVQVEASEKPIKLVHVLNPGEREYLSPNLIGLQNIAMTYLPLSLNFINIIDAFREIVNGVRYEVVLNAVDSKDKNIEKVCRLVILEKPWLRTEWGDNVRELHYSNCTDDNETIQSNAINGKFDVVNPLFNGGSRSELTQSDMANLESQIVPTTNMPDFMTTFDPSISNDSNDDGVNKELNEDDKRQLDNIFSIGSDAEMQEQNINKNINDLEQSNSKDHLEEGLEDKQIHDEHSRSKRDTRAKEFSEKKILKKLDHYNLRKTEHLFNKFQIKFNRNYQTTLERQMRLRIFANNLKIIDELNRNEMGSAKYGITEFADLTSAEYKQRTGLLNQNMLLKRGDVAEIPNVELPKEFDWRDKGAITKVKNQGNCGSCWAFSVTGNIEGLHAIKTGKIEEYSEQELLDCDTVDSACNGGLPDNAYEAIKKIGGLELEDEYPYAGRKQQCRFSSNKVHVKVNNFVDLPKNETAIAQWLITNGPISIGINANAMQFYRGGVSHPWKPLCSHSNLDHGVLIVGFGVSDYPMFKKTLPYWIIKNSWGPKWGEQGYYRVYRGDNTCGVSEMASSAVLAD